MDILPFGRRASRRRQGAGTVAGITAIAADGFAIEVQDFVHAVATGAEPEMDGEAGLRAKALCEACYESATAGRPVKFADVLEGRLDAYQRPIDAFWKL